MSQRPRSPRVQYASLPYRRAEDGGLLVALVTSRSTRRWVIPKGWPMKGRKPSGAAAREAFEEAGLVGDVTKAAIGAYSYDKRLKSGATVPCRVEVFPFQVKKERKRWPEQAERELRWFPLDEAASLVDEPDLADLIRSLPEHLAR